jgi:regulator of cell morphogenesis and NO signaling
MIGLSEQVRRVEKDWREAPLKSLVEHLVRDHRSWRAREFPLIEHLFDRIEHSPGSPQPAFLTSLRRAFYRLRAEIEGHMSREENVLFPAIVDVEHGSAGGAAVRRSTFGSIRNPITMLEDDHDEDERLLAAVREAAHGYEVPEAAGESVRVLFHELQALEAAMHAHTRLESSILFARALRMSAEKRTSTAEARIAVGS